MNKDLKELIENYKESHGLKEESLLRELEVIIQERKSRKGGLLLELIKKIKEYYEKCINFYQSLSVIIRRTIVFLLILAGYLICLFIIPFVILGIFSADIGLNWILLGIIPFICLITAIWVKDILWLRGGIMFMSVFIGIITAYLFDVTTKNKTVDKNMDVTDVVSLSLAITGLLIAALEFILFFVKRKSKNLT